MGQTRIPVQEKGCSPLKFPILDNDPDKINLLIEAGADPNVARKIDGFTALILTSSFGNFDFVKLLVEAGTEIGKLLISKGAKVNEQGKQGNSPLIFAVSLGHTDY